MTSVLCRRHPVHLSLKNGRNTTCINLSSVIEVEYITYSITKGNIISTYFAMFTSNHVKWNTDWKSATYDVLLTTLLNKYNIHSIVMFPHLSKSTWVKHNMLLVTFVIVFFISTLNLLLQIVCINICLWL